MTAKQQELWTGAMFMALGILTVSLSLDYGLWAGRSVGSGLFPVGLGTALTILGVIQLLLSLSASELRASEWVLRPILTVCAAIAAFGFLIDRAGTLIALAVSLVIVAFGDRPNIKYLVIVYVVVVAFVYFFLARFLGLPYRMW